MRHYCQKYNKGLVTILPELLLNIANAYLYRNEFETAKMYAEQAVEESRLCMD